MKTWFPIVSTAAAVFFCVLWLTGSCDKPTTKPDDGELWRDQVAQRDEVIRIKDSIIYALQAREKRIITKANTDSTKWTSENRRLYKDYAKAKEEVKHLRDSIPEIDVLITAADSLLNVKDSLYSQESGRRIAMESLYKTEIAEMADRNIVQKEISSLLESKVTDLTNQNDKLARKLEKKKKGNRLLLGIASGIGAALAITILSQ